MTSSGWTGPALVLARALEGAVRAARAADADGFTAAVAEVRRLDPELVAVVAGAMAQSLLERLHPDGLDAEDAAEVLAGVAGDSGWYAAYLPDAATLALLGALGVAADDAPPVPPAAVAEHGLLLVASMLPSPRDLGPLVDAALRELHRAQTVELP